MQLTTIYFARLEEQQNNFISKGPLIPSNAKVDDRFYLLNAPPGRYVAIAARGSTTMWATGPTGSPISTGEFPYYIAFSKPLIALTEVKAELEHLTFMGRFGVKASRGSGVAGADEVQVNTIRYFGTLLFLGSVEDVKQGVESAQEFLAKARDDLGESAWRTVIQESLAFPERK